MSDKSKKVAVIVLGVLVLVAVGHAVWKAQPRSKPDPLRPTGPIKEKFLQAQTPIGVCEFWQVLAKITAPEPLTEAANRAETLIGKTASKTLPFKDWLNGKMGDEQVCILGQVKGETTQMEARPSVADCYPTPLLFPNYGLTLKVHATTGPRYNNDFTLELGTGPVSTSRLLSFAGDVLPLAFQGLTGWRHAFPTVSRPDLSGVRADFGFSNEDFSPNSPSRIIHFRGGYDPQEFWRSFPTFANYLLRLDELVKMNTTIENESGAKITKIETTTDRTASLGSVRISKGTLLSLDDDDFKWDPSAPTTQTFKVKHNVEINFRGLKIAIDGMSFLGTLSFESGQAHYQGAFSGIDNLEVTGEFDSPILSGMSGMIRELIETEIRNEVENLTEGNNGEGWIIEAKMSDKPLNNSLVVRMVFEARLNLIEILRHRYEDEQVNVMPSAHVRNQFNQWSAKFVQALASDTRVAAEKCSGIN